jgi:flagellum-specific ATP synthase
MIHLERYRELLPKIEPFQTSGVVLRVIGLTVIASGPAVPIGETCQVVGGQGLRRTAVVVGFREGEVLLQPIGHPDGIRSGDRVIALGHPLVVPVGPGLIGRVIDGVGNPLDGLGPVTGSAKRSIHGDPPPALGRTGIKTILETGIKSIDTMFAIGKGQRMGIFAGSGLGKSTLLGEIAKYATADVNVIALVGERGREVGDFIDKVLGKAGLRKSVVIVATSDRPAVERLSAAYTAHAVAEHFRDAGLDVLLIMDSVTRFCQAQRDIGLSAGEPPVTRGYPPSAFAILPRLLERAGTSVTGTITGLYTVLIDADDENDPVGDNARAILDGHLFLSRRLAGQAIYPAIDPTLSVSRLAVDIVDPIDYRLGNLAREMWGEYERVRDLVEVGAYRKGADPRVDRAIEVHPKLLEFMRQDIGTVVPRSESLARLRAALGEGAV